MSDDLVDLMERSERQAQMNLAFLKRLNERQRIINRILYVVFGLSIINLILLFLT